LKNASQPVECELCLQRRGIPFGQRSTLRDRHFGKQTRVENIYWSALISFVLRHGLMRWAKILDHAPMSFIENALLLVLGLGFLLML
jgi:hypothetical protein